MLKDGALGEPTLNVTAIVAIGAVAVGTVTVIESVYVPAASPDGSALIFNDAGIDPLDGSIFSQLDAAALE